ncbi:MAG: HD domain-containing phosphohydrolase [Desulfomonilia bacterium]|jgi:HD-GYP domain-containing protein (c-di-GMP phosphodiesterase class II)
MESFREIPLSMVHVGHVYDFDIYLKLQDTKRLFAAKGVPLTRVHLIMTSHSETQLYVREEEWATARNEFEHDIRYVFTDPRLDSRQKADLIYTLAMQSIRDAYNGLIPRAIVDVQKDADEQVKHILSDEEVLGHLRLMSTSGGSIYQHSLRVGIYATTLLLKLMGERLTSDQIRRISMGFFLHDIGMARVPIQILTKPGRLDDFEMRLIRMHPIWGQKRMITTGSLSLEAVNIILAHHEHLDGSGYPHNRSQDGIPLYARICTIADAFEALTAERPYRKALAPFSALQVMYQDLSHGFDPELFMAFVKLLGPDA